jgi:LPS-assembly lipoprotein
MFRFITFCSALLILTACGFQLRGSYDLPDSLQTLYVAQSKQFNPLIRTVKIRLKQNNVNVVETYSETISALLIQPEKFQRQTLSLLPNGQIAEYKLVYQVEFVLQQPGKNDQKFRFELTREFQDDPNNALAKERERELILSELRVMASDRILSQLNSVL